MFSFEYLVLGKRNLKNKMLNKITNNIIVKHIQNFFIYKFPPFTFILIIQYHTAFYMSIKQFFNIKTSSEKLNAIFNIKICQFTKKWLNFLLF